MPASTGVLGFGTILSYSDTSGGTYVAIAQTKDFEGPDITRGTVKITNNDSPNSYHEFLPGLLDAGTISFSVVFTKAQRTTLETLTNGASNKKFWRLTFIDGSKWEAEGFIVSIADSAATEDAAIESSIEIKLTGEPNYTAAT